ncbi:MAG: DUF7504 family protein [Thermoplasmata archaeon]
MVKCKECGGEIDENTLVCKKCNRKYTKEEFEELLAKEILDKFFEETNLNLINNINKNIQELELSINENKTEISNIFEDLDLDIQTMNIEEAQKKISEREEILRKNIEDLKRRYQDLENIKKELTITFKNILDKIAMVNDLKNANNIIKVLIEYSEKIVNLNKQISELYKELQKTKNILEILKREINVSTDEELINKIKELKTENNLLKLDLESFENRLKVQKDIWEDWVKNQDEKISKLAEEEAKLKEMEIELEKASKEIALKEQELKNSGGINHNIISTLEVEALKQENETLKNEITRLTNLVNALAEGSKAKDDIIKSSEYEKLRAENDNLRSQLAAMEQAMNDLKKTLKYKDEEFARREQDLQYREKKLQEQMKQLESQRLELEEVKKLEAEHKIQDLADLIKQKEQELKAKEKYLRELEAELEAKEKGLIDKELAIAQEEVQIEIKEEKVKTGTRRLDDLLYGGFPLGSNILIYGPAYTGKEVLIYSFLAEGVRKGIPVIIILIDKTVDIFEKDIKFVLPAWDSFVEKGLVKYIDAYSKSIGEKTDRKDVLYLDSQTDLAKISEVVDNFASEIKKNYKYYRLAFISISTILTFAEPQTVVRFLQPFTTKRKKENAVSLYLLEKGLHEENTIQMVSYLMDGMIEFKVEGGKVYLQVKGITEVQSRAWIEVTPSNTGLIIGSFTLGHIR